jgi:PhnB protein
MADTMNTYRTITPYLVVPDADAELTFLKAAFGGTEVTCQRNDDNTVMHAEITIGDSLIMLGQAGDQWNALTAALYLWVDNVDATYAKALQAGATSQSAPGGQAVRAPERWRRRSKRHHLVDRLSDSIDERPW